MKLDAATVKAAPPRQTPAMPMPGEPAGGLSEHGVEPALGVGWSGPRAGDIF